MTTVKDDKTIVREYFDATGFERWKRIYGTDEVNKVQLDIRKGHQRTIETVVDWLQQDNNLQGLTICDAGCGVGSLAIPLAAAGAKVYATDISAKMVSEARQIAGSLGQAQENLSFDVKDLEELAGRFHTVICLDVLIHYPESKAHEMLTRLCSLAESRVIVSFAPKTPFYSSLKKIGSFFPGPSKATRAYLHREESVIQSLISNGMKIERVAMNKTRFYFSRTIEAKRG